MRGAGAVEIKKAMLASSIVNDMLGQLSRLLIADGAPPASARDGAEAIAAHHLIDLICCRRGKAYVRQFMTALNAVVRDDLEATSDEEVRH